MNFISCFKCTHFKVNFSARQNGFLNSLISWMRDIVVSHVNKTEFDNKLSSGKESNKQQKEIRAMRLLGLGR